MVDSFTRECAAGKERVKEILAEGIVVKLGQRIDIENWCNQGTGFRQNLFDNLDYVHTHHFFDFQTLLTEADQLRGLVDIVHEDAPVVLGFLKDLGLTAGDVAGLRQALPFKNALTSVFRVMGSSAPLEHSGRNDRAGTFDKLLSLIIWIAQEHYRLAQEIYVAFGIMVRMGRYSEWSAAQWDGTKVKIEVIIKQAYQC